MCAEKVKHIRINVLKSIDSAPKIWVHQFKLGQLHALYTVASYGVIPNN